ncbi:MAG: hypothetical protein HYV29_11095 [Ignavibacteriales bacterium]|nr:hypothetical protein [Ignavibacteriales bacterium]
MTPFRFHSKLDLTVLLGTRAKNIIELLGEIRSVPAMSIYYHTHRFLHQHHYLSPEPPNDFAYWVTHVMNDTVLGEQLWSVDVIQYRTIEQLRNKFIEVVEAYVQSTSRRYDCIPGQEFHFMASQTFVFPTPHTAESLAEFKEALRHVSINSLYYHMFDSKLRLARDENDFSRWCSDLGYTELSDHLRKLDPYAHSLDGLRKRIIFLVNKYGGN